MVIGSCFQFDNDNTVKYNTRSIIRKYMGQLITYTIMFHKKYIRDKFMILWYRFYDPTPKQWQKCPYFQIGDDTIKCK